MRYRLTYCLIIVCLSNAYSKNIHVRDFNPVSGTLSNSTVSCMIQDSEGYIWLGTWDGLNRFDGYENKIYRHIEGDSNSLSNNIITALTEDQNGNIWIGSEKLNVFNKKTGMFETLNITFKAPVRSLFADSENYLWLATDETLYKINTVTQSYEFFDLIFEDKDVRVNDIIEDNKRTIYLATEYGLYIKEYAEKQFTLFNNTLHKTPGANNFNSLLIHDNSLWIGSYWGFYQFNLIKRTYAEFEHEELNDSNFISLDIDTKKHIWIVSEHQTIIEYDPEKNIAIRHTPLHNKLSLPAIRFLFFDSYGQMWISCQKRGIKYKPFSQPFVNVSAITTDEDNLLKPAIYSFLKESDSILWIGSSHGLIAYNIVKNSGILSFKNVEIRTMEKSGNYLWIGTLSDGLFRLSYDNSTYQTTILKQYNYSGGLNTNVIFSLKIDSQQNIWTGSYNRLYKKKSDQDNFEVVEIVSNDTIFKELQVWEIFEDHKGILWIGTQRDGLFRYNPSDNTYQNFRADNRAGLNSNAIKSILETDTLNLYIGTEGGGLNIFDRTTATATTLTESHGLVNNTIWGLLSSDNGLWISTNNGISNYKDKIFYSYDTDNGLSCDEFNIHAAIRISDTSFLFGCTEGMVLFDPANIKPRNFKPMVVFPEIIVNQKKEIPSFDSSGYHLQLPPGIYDIGVTFAALEFSSPRKCRYAYRLTGYDTTWQITNADQRIAQYNKISAGSYNFELRVSLHGNSWYDPDRILVIDIASPWHASRLFYWIIAVVVASVVLLLLFYHRKRLLLKYRTRNNQEIQFENKLIAILENHYSDIDFSVEKFALEMAYSRSMLHKKLKQNLGKSAGEYIRDFRLEKAREKLKSSNLSIKEISFECGFSDSSYFSKCFKQKFGYLPTEHR